MIAECNVDEAIRLCRMRYTHGPSIGRPMIGEHERCLAEVITQIVQRIQDRGVLLHSFDSSTTPLS